MARAGLRALEFYDPTTKKHGQAHMQARYVPLPLLSPSQRPQRAHAAVSLGITQHLIKSGIARLEEVRAADGALENAYVRVDREKVLTEGRAAVGKLLVELQVRKSTADGAGARAFYTELTTPFPGWDGEIRDLVLRKKLVRAVVLGVRWVILTFFCSRGRSSCSRTRLLRTARSCSRSTRLARLGPSRALLSGSSELD